MSYYYKKSLIIFTRYPEVGKTKTRLIPALGEEGAAKLQQKLTEDTIQKLSEVPVQFRVYFSGGNEELMKQWLGNHYSYYPQSEGNLGDKLIAALTETFSEEVEKVVIIGIDCPDLDATLINQAFSELSDQDLVLGKAEDGGYYLIGLRDCIPELFQGITWGTDQVLQETVAIAEKLGLKISYLPLLNDVDTPEDLEQLNFNFPD
ncbi:glycosyltransferase [Euhalothece natronophila Z-M001]|uniref:Glycosyltransferase n=1 Tax=Euhalothece natronophila Z-M001 TaxID=522448 RepID=A0A5B8NPL4_9CHRO|nr:TIGR04282 family arsenosugar biosynthesis glycosyltransferase [Euhalothece natronophila]QDZ40085.1 glycosyltransferase [Euhalothece natronophila Z-M001]